MLSLLGEEVRSLLAVDFLRGWKWGGGVSHACFPDPPDCVYSCIQPPQRLQSSSVLHCALYFSQIGGEGMQRLQWPGSGACAGAGAGTKHADLHFFCSVLCVESAARQQNSASSALRISGLGRRLYTEVFPGLPARICWQAGVTQEAHSGPQSAVLAMY